MQKKKPAKPKPNRVEVKLPIAPESVHEDLIVVAIPVDPAKIIPMDKTCGPVPCIATKIRGWTGEYIMLAAEEGMLPYVSEEGTKVDVVFNPPCNP